MTGAFLAAAFFAVALLYASVGHAGASGYLAVMALAGTDPAVMKPAALLLNLLVSTIAAAKFLRAGHFSAPLFWRFCLPALPAAFLGGGLSLPAPLFRPLVGAVLLYAAAMLAFGPRPEEAAEPRTPSWAVAIPAGSLIGLLSGMLGVGGGIFLSPLLLLCGYGKVKTVAGVSAAFIWANSLAGFLGHAASLKTLPAALPLWAVAVAAGGWVGAELGSKRLAPKTIRDALALVLLVAGAKLFLR